MGCRVVDPVAGMVEAELIDASQSSALSLQTSSCPPALFPGKRRLQDCLFFPQDFLTLQSLLEGDSINEGSWMEKRGKPSWMGKRETKKSVHLNVLFPINTVEET